MLFFKREKESLTFWKSVTFSPWQHLYTPPPYPKARKPRVRDRLVLRRSGENTKQNKKQCFSSPARVTAEGSSCKITQMPSMIQIMTFQPTATLGKVCILPALPSATDSLFG